MALTRYSVAATKDHLSSLIDKALAGEEVIITRHGRPTVALSAVDRADDPVRTRIAALERLTAIRGSLPKLDLPYLHLKRIDEEERGF